MENKLLEIVDSWQSVINNFKKRSDVQNGWGIAWKKRSEQLAQLENVPFGIGDGLGTTGWCVSASEALLYDNIFQQNLLYRNCKAKLISIDIKEQYYGYCYNGSQNKWHTAILIEDSNINIVVDITCRQFGNDFVGKDIWDFDTWQRKLRSPLCKHHITDFTDSPQFIAPVLSTENSDVNNKEPKKTMLLYDLKNVTNLTDYEREQLSNFVLTKVDSLNNSILTKNITTIDFNYITEINKLLNNLPYNSVKKAYSILKFETKESAKNWIELLLTNNNELPNYLFASETVEKSCLLNYFSTDELNITNNLSVEKNKTFVVFEFDELFGIDVSWYKNASILLPPGIILNINSENIYNSGKLINQPADQPERQTNTIIIKVDKY